MSGLNKVMIIGRLGQDPEVKNIGENTVAKLSVATTEIWYDKNNQKQERTEWHRVVAWGKQAENAGKYLSKGRQCYVEGKIQTRTWDDNDGKKRYAVEIVATNIQYLGDGGGQRNNSAQSSGQEAQYPNFDQGDEIPF